MDATGVASFQKRHCEHCLHKTSKKSGKTTYFHNVLEAKLVFTNGFSISLGTEWVENPQEYEANCELKAFKRLAVKLKKWFPRLPICILADSLYPSQQFFDICQKNEWNFIVTLKEGKLPSVWLEALSLLEISKDNNRTENRVSKNESIPRDYFWVNGIDYHGHSRALVEMLRTGEKD